MKTFTLLILSILVASCSRNVHLTGDYEKFSKGHRTIAVLPYDITVIGKDAREMEREQIDLMIESESSLFQQSLYSEILKRTGISDKDIQISVQPVRKTNRLLKEKNIGPLNIAEYGAMELGNILGVDAVVSTRLIKEGFLSRETAMIADVVSQTVLDKVAVPSSILLNRNKLTRSSKVDIYAYIIDIDNEAPIWQFNQECDLSWSMEPSEVIEKINGRISKRFPYRSK